MYDYAQLHVGIDTIKFKLEPKNQNDHEVKELLDILKDHIRTALKHDELPCVHYVKDQRAWLVFSQIDIDYGYPVCRFYHLGKGDMYVELFGMFQAHDGSILKLNETHQKILETLSNLNDQFMISITKLDLSIDYFYDYNKSFCYFYGVSPENNINKIMNQPKNEINYFGRFPMHTIEIPINRDDFHEFIEKKHRKIKRKNVGEKRPNGSYYRYGIFKNVSVFRSFSECEKEYASHIQLKINDKKLLYEVKNLFNGKETWTYDFDETEDIKLSKSKAKASWISYDKKRRDIDGGKDNESEENTHAKIRMEYANNDEDLADELEYDYGHSRIELRLLNPGAPRDKKPLDSIDELTYQKIMTDLESRIKKLTLVLISPDITNGVYIKFCRDVQRGKTKFEPVKPNKIHGRMLKPIDFVDSILNELDIIKSFFIK